MLKDDGCLNEYTVLKYYVCRLYQHVPKEYGNEDNKYNPENDRDRKKCNLRE